MATKTLVEYQIFEAGKSQCDVSAKTIQSALKKFNALRIKPSFAFLFEFVAFDDSSVECKRLGIYHSHDNPRIGYKKGWQLEKDNSNGNHSSS